MSRAVRYGAMTMIGFLAASNLALAGRPLNMDDTEPVENGRWQFEAGGDYQHATESDRFDYPFALTYGVFPCVELGAGFGGPFEERTETGGATGHENGLGDLSITPKWKFLDQARFLPSQAASFTVKFPTAKHNGDSESEATDYDLTWIASEKLGEKMQIDANLGYSWIGNRKDDAADDFFHYGLALEYQLLEPLQWVGEVFAQRETTGGAETMVQYNTGFRWGATDGLTFDVAAGSRISGDAPDFTGTLGLTWVFGNKNNK